MKSCMNHRESSPIREDTVPLISTKDVVPKKKRDKLVLFCCMVVFTAVVFSHVRLKEGMEQVLQVEPDKTSSRIPPLDANLNKTSLILPPQKKNLDICTFSPEDALNAPCKQKLNEKKRSIFGERTQGRLLLFGDSTMWRLATYGVINGNVADQGALGTLNHCNPNHMCNIIHGGRCNDTINLQQQRAAVWNPPNASLGEGPHEYGLENHFCSDCDGCNTRMIMCNQHSELHDATTNDKPCKANDDTLFLHGGYISITFARDVELQTPDVSTTQEVLATFLREFYNTAPLVKDFGLPICVVNTGIHDVAIATKAQFLQNVKWYVGLLTPQCSMIVWITTTAPATEKFDQKINQTKSWNEGVVQGFRDEGSSELLDKLFVVDVYPPSINYAHENNVHMESTWYRQLSVFIYDALSKL